MFQVLIAGCGNIAGRFDETGGSARPPLSHAGAYRAHGGFALAAAIEPDAARRAEFGAFWGVPRLAGSWQALAARPGQFDVISICSPTAAHGGDLAAALALRPRLVFAEKPLTLSADETAHWVEQYRAAGVLLAVNHTRRWAPDAIELAERLRSGACGAVRSASAVYTKGILNNGSHMIDLLTMLLGELRLVAVGRPVRDFWPDDPSIPALLETAAGAPVALTVGHAADFALFELQIVTEAGTIQMRDGGWNWAVRTVEPDPAFAGYSRLSAAKATQGRYGEAMTRAAANIAAALGEGQALACTGEMALAAQTHCAAIGSAVASRAGNSE